MVVDSWPKSCEEYTKRILRNQEAFPKYSFVNYTRQLKYMNDNKEWLRKAGVIKIRRDVGFNPVLLFRKHEYFDIVLRHHDEPVHDRIVRYLCQE